MAVWTFVYTSSHILTSIHHCGMYIRQNVSEGVWGGESGVRVEADILREKCSYQGRTEVRGSSESGGDMEVSLGQTWESRTG